MKNSFVILISIILTVTGFSQTKVKTLSVDLNNPVIFLNSNRVDNNSQIELKNGLNILSIYRNNNEWDSGMISDTLILSGNKIHSKVLQTDFTSDTLKLTYKFPAKVIIDTDPQNALVGDYGYSPIVSSRIKEPVLIKKKFFESYLLKKVEPVNKIKLKFKGRPVERKFTESVWFPVLIGTAALLGGISAYYKTKADKKYDEYLTNKSSSLLDETNRMDLISGVSLGILQVNLGYIIYNLIFND